MSESNQLLNDLTFSPFKKVNDLKDVKFILSGGNIAILENEYIRLSKMKIAMTAPVTKDSDLDIYLAELRNIEGKIEMITTIISWHNNSLRSSSDKQHQSVATASDTNVTDPDFIRAAALVSK